MAQPQTQSQADAPQARNEGPSPTVKVRVKHGRLLVGRTPPKFNASGQIVEESGDERYAEVGEVVEVSRKWAETLLKREFDGYPSTFTNGAPGVVPGTIRDCPIELVH